MFTEESVGKRFTGRFPASKTEKEKTVMKKDLSVRETEALVKKLNRPEPKVVTEEPPVVDYTAELEKKMTAKLGNRVRITGKGTNRRLEITLTDDKMLDELVKKLCGENIFDE